MFTNIANFNNTSDYFPLLNGVLIILIGLIIVRAIYFYIFDTFSIEKFIILAVIVQSTHDILFYTFFTIARIKL